MGDNSQIRATDLSITNNNYSFFILLGAAALVCTFLRVSLLILYPFVALFLCVYYRWKLTSSFFTLTILLGLGFLFSFFNGFFLGYKMMSLYYMFPFLLLLFANTGTISWKNEQSLTLFIRALTWFAIVNNAIGIVQVMINPDSDDSFLGIYSQFSISINGLMLINAVLAFYYMSSFLYTRKKTSLLATLFFFTCSVLGFYGAGLLAFLIAFVLAFFRSKETAVIKTILVSVVSVLSIYFVLLMVKPDVLIYNIANIKKLMSLDVDSGPRKITAFYNYGISYPKNAKDFLFGSGPGTFNSRSAFMVGSPSYFTEVPFIKEDKQPYYFKNFAYTLWNENNTQQSLYLDGFRNQPFSSLLAFLGEYGLLFTFAFFTLYFYLYTSVSKIFRSVSHLEEAQEAFRFFKFLVILLPILLVIDNYYEYPEIMLLILLGMKFAEARLRNLVMNKAVMQEP